MINGKTVPVDYNNFVLGPVSAAAGEFWRDALSYLIITGSLACAAALTNAGLRYMYAMGREGLLPRYLGKTHPVHKSPYTAVLTWGVLAAVLFLLFRLTSHTGLDAYFWLSPQGVIWIVLVQALTALSVFTYFRREHPERAVVEDDRVRVARLRRPDLRARALLPLRDVRGRGHLALRQGALHDRIRDWYSVPVSWLGIIGVARAGRLDGLRLRRARAATRSKYALMGRFVNESASSERPAGAPPPRRRPGGSQCGSNRLRPVAAVSRRSRPDADTPSASGRPV